MLFLRYYLWSAPHLLLGILLIGLVRRRLYRQLPIFFSYVAFELTQFLVLFTINVAPRFSLFQYNVAFVAGLGISTFLKLGFVYEVSTELLVSHSTLAKTLRSLLGWITALLLFVAAIASAALFRSGIESAETIFRTLDFSWSVILSGLLIILFLFTRAFAIAWRSFAAGASLGFGLFAAIELATSALRGELGLSGDIRISVIQMAGYHVCVLVWLAYLFLPERVPSFSGRGLEKPDLEFWDQELQRMVRR